MAIDSKRLAGQAFVSVDGQQYLLAGDLEYRVSKVEREPLVGQDQVHGYAEKPTFGYIKGTFRDSGSLSLSAINAMTGVSVLASLANGKHITGSNMWTAGAQEVKTMDGTFEIEFQGARVEES